MASSTRFGGITLALANPQFRLYTLGSLPSLLGTWIQRLAVAWLAWKLTQSHAWVGAIAMADMLPVVFLAPFAGAIAARMEFQKRNRIIPRSLTDPFILNAERFLSSLAQQTGGKVLRAEAFGSLGDVYGQVAEELKNQYYISYTPSNIIKDGRWRAIEIRSRQAGVILSTRPGYYAPSSDP